MYHILAIRNLLRRKTRTLLSALGVMVGVAMIISLVSVSGALKRTTDQFASSLGNTIFVVSEGTFGPPMASRLDIDAVGQIEKIPGVKVAAPLIITIVTIENYQSTQGLFGGSSSTVGFVGIDPQKEKQIGSDYTKIVSGRFINPGEKNKVIIGAVLASRTGKTIGDDIEFSYRAENYDYEIVGIYESGSSQTDDNIVGGITEAQKIGEFPSYRINAVNVLAENPAQNEVIERKIKLLVPNTDPSYARAFASTLSSFTSALEIATWVIAGISAIIGGIGIANTMVMSVLEQTKELGILKAVGWRKADILGLVVLESVAISILGAFFGVVVGSFVVLGILPNFLSGDFSPTVRLETVFLAVMFAVGLGVLGGLIPAKRASEMNPVEAFRNA